MWRPIFWGPIILGVGVGAAIGNATGNLVTGIGLGLMFGILAGSAARKSADTTDVVDAASEPDENGLNRPTDSDTDSDS